MDHAKPLAKMEQMLEPKYLEIVDQDELNYDDGLFYSFYYYSKQVLLLLKPLLEQSDDEWSKKLYELI